MKTQWDNFVQQLNDQSLLRFALTCARSQQEEQNAKSKIFMHICSTTGERLSSEVNITPNHTAWGGSCLSSDIGMRELPPGASSTISLININAINEKGAKAKEAFLKQSFIIAYTTPYISHSFNGLYRPQATSILIKPKDKMHLFGYKNVIDPYARRYKNQELYNFGDSENVISCSRDPFLIKEGDEYHIFFAARYSKIFFENLPTRIQEQHYDTSTHTLKQKHVYDEEVNSTIGHAISNNLIDWELMSPLTLPETASQFELPCVIKKEDGLVITVVVSNGNVAVENPERGERKFGTNQHYLSVFRINSTLSALRPGCVWSHCGETSKETCRLDRTYGTAFTSKDDSDVVFMSAFYLNDKFLTHVESLDKKDFPKNIPNEEIFKEGK